MINRGRIEIMAEILAFCSQPKLKTNVMYNANLSFKQFENYLTLLASFNLLAQNLDKYVTTEKGHRFLEAFGQLEEALETESNTSFQTGLFSRIGQIKYNSRFRGHLSANSRQQ